MLDRALFDVKVFMDDGDVVRCDPLRTWVAAQRLGMALWDDLSAVLHFLLLSEQKKVRSES